MELKLSEHIKNLRKERGLTQEQFAEAMGVTVGAVSKWESASTVPELSMILDIADFFEVSVDVLLGYEPRSVNLTDTLAEIVRLKKEGRYEEAAGLGEQAIRKFPNHFDLVYQTAGCYLSFGMNLNSRSYSLRAQQLLRRSLDLIDQNRDPRLDAWSIKNQLADSVCFSNEFEECLKLYQDNNVGGINDPKIAIVLADYLGRSQEALPYIKKSYAGVMEAFLNLFGSLMAAALSWQKPEEAVEILLWMGRLLEGLRPEGGICATDKITSNFWQTAGELYLGYLDNEEQGRFYLEKAIRLARSCDRIPADQVVTCRFFDDKEKNDAFISYFMGQTAEEVLRARLDRFPQYRKVWEEIYQKVAGKEA